ncbi:hypothetical protein KAFR_0J01960 [Kazachstania africana CBS 2517]|uniref:Uncharacterized protein n=1 Tax=Kazachstania africana (strain ATCC 22294 / BCRC 22015 / CBS 2517 / CECT 1963 / NBRC 1671 / NRRL Y-8276) TaxID=1071382 RepID=H2B0W0_KAZAF|nr:hypothetical protein KAFR_0J01960 [Kazachstania africana CBS 2517]CCF60260.1 hypothetical protein KAFR_0J01960 [Kazachstania africana CBS 2517]
MSSDTSDTAILNEENDSLIHETGSSIMENFKSLAAGGVGGVSAVATGHPFDLVKVRCQNGQAINAKDAVLQIWSNSKGHGLFPINLVRNFYKGVIPPLLGVTPIFAVSFWGYDVGKKIVSYNNNYLTNLSTSQMAGAGFISAIPTTLITAPTERIKVVLQTSKNKQSVATAASKILHDGGITSLFKGSLATLARDGPGSALYFASYEVVKKKLNKESDQLSVKNICLAGGIAGMSMWLVVFPIDTIKTKLQASSTKQSMINATREIYSSRGGIKGFFPGLGPALLRSFPANAATFLGVELTHSFFKRYNI